MAEKAQFRSLAARIKQQAENLSQTYREHANEVTEDYVEAIADQVAETGEALVVDLAQRLGVTHVTVSHTVPRLQKAGLATSQPYRAIFRTDTGTRLAARCKDHHKTVVVFLCSGHRPECGGAGRGRNRTRRQSRHISRFRCGFAKGIQGIFLPWKTRAFRKNNENK
jgi:DtxR family manganese transport transcriptional regulator